jgi:hypothetical protein
VQVCERIVYMNRRLPWKGCLGRLKAFIEAYNEKLGGEQERLQAIAVLDKLAEARAEETEAKNSAVRATIARVLGM